MNKKNYISILTTCLYIILFSLVFLGISRLIYGFYELFRNFSFFVFILILINLIYFFNYFKACYHLLNILKSAKLTPFIVDNVKRFRLIGCYLLINTCIELIMRLDIKHFKLIGFGEGSIDPLIVICFISALMCFVLSEVFNKAIKIKIDNDLTI